MKLLDPKTNYEYVDLTLYLMDVKILHNACVDILREYPEMEGYRQVMTKLAMVIEDAEFSIENDLPF